MSLRTELGALVFGLGLATTAISGADRAIIGPQVAEQAAKAADPKFSRPSNEDVAKANSVLSGYHGEIDSQGNKNGNIDNVGSVPRTGANPAYATLKARVEADARLDALQAPRYPYQNGGFIAGGVLMVIGGATWITRRR